MGVLTRSGKFLDTLGPQVSIGKSLEVIVFKQNEMSSKTVLWREVRLRTWVWTWWLASRHPPGFTLPHSPVGLGITPGLCLPLALCPQGGRLPSSALYTGTEKGGSLVCGESPRRVIGGHSTRKRMQQAASEIPRGYLPVADFLPYHVLSPSI